MQLPKNKKESLPLTMAHSYEGLDGGVQMSVV